MVNLVELIKNKPVAERVDKKVISHSQFTVYKNCPYQWYLRYVQKIRPFTSTINTVFGTAMHETFQEYISVMYSKSGKAADDIHLEALFLERFKVNYMLEVEKNDGIHFSNPDEMAEFFEDGVAIIKWFKRKRREFFGIKGYKLLGIEIPIMQPTEANPNVYFNGYIDLIIYDKVLDRIVIYDIKTSKRGWSDKYEKKDESKLAQILWYKRYFSRQYEIPEEKIEVVFFILKRKIYEDAEFPIPRVQIFRPAHGTGKMNKAAYEMESFVNECFTPLGEFQERVYLKTPSAHNCKFCPFDADESLCDKINL